VELDRALAFAMRKNLGTAERLLKSSLGEAEKSELRVYLDAHPLSRNKQAADQPTEPVPRALSERERFLERIARVLSGLSDQNLLSIYEFAKTMGRVQRSQGKPESPKTRRQKSDAGKKAEDTVTEGAAGSDAGTSAEP
jgi:SOS response regulatory protein OraA/RecX